MTIFGTGLKFHSLFLIISNALLIFGCGVAGLHERGHETKISTVEIAKTDVKNQGRLGVCWSYGTIGLVESVAKKNGIEVDLSEEQIVFYHIAETLLQMFQTLSTVEILEAMWRSQLPEGWNARIQPEDELPIPAGTQKQHDALELLDLYGAVPEADWSFKVPNGVARKMFFDSITNNVLALLKQGEVLKYFTLNDVIEKVLISDGAFPSAPPRFVQWQGQRIDSVDFLKNRLKFRPADFGSFVVRKSEQYENFVMVLKEALVLGMAVPFAYPISIDRLKGDLFTGSDITDDKNWYAFAEDGGHLVLITDFVNKGGKRGAMDPDFALNEMLAPASNLQEIIFKNSWGVGSKTNEDGESIGYSKDGYYRMDVSYLKGAMRVPELTGNRWSAVQVVLPKALLIKHAL